MSKVNLSNPSKAEQMKQLNVSPYQEESNVTMMKVLETYKRSVDYYNSYGLNSAPNSTRVSRNSTERPASGAGSFWDDVLRF